MARERRKQWSRLEIEIEAEAASSALSIIPFPQNDQFVGRESQLAELEAKLFGGKHSTIVITGPGGTGKTQLALELAYRTRQKNESCSVFWIDASDIDSLYQSYTRIAQKLNISGWNDEKADIKQLLKLHLSREGARQWLLIYDNAGDIDQGSSGLSTARATNLIDYLPQSEVGSIIFTTAYSNTAKKLVSPDIIELGQMTPDAAQTMFGNYLSILIPRNEQDETKLLLQELSYLPLAIVQAAAYINTRNITLQTYRALLLEQKDDASELPEDKLQGYGTRDPVATNTSPLNRPDPPYNSLAANYLFLAACIDRKDIPFELLEASSPFERDNAIKVLTSYALITRRPAESALDIHQLVHSALRRTLEKQEKLEPWARHAITQLCRVFPDDDHSSRSKWRRLLPHAKYALLNSVTEQESADRARLVWKCAMALVSDGWYNESEELFMQLIETRKRMLGDEHPSTLTSMANLASTYRNQGRWNEAEELQVKDLEICLKVLGDEHPDTLTSMGNLASTYINQGRWKEAEKLEMQVIETRKRVLGGEHPSTLTSMANLALMYWNQGRWKEAEELQAKDLEVCSRVLGDEHPDTLTSMSNLASTYRDQGRWKKAEELEVQVVESRKRVLGDEHPDTLTSMIKMATIYWNQGRLKEAEKLEMQVIETRKRVLGDEHPDMLTSMANLALTYWNQGRWKEAEELQAKDLEVCLRVLGGEHPDTLTSMGNLASTYRDQGRWKKAEELEVQVMESRKRVLGDEHPDTLAIMSNLAFTQKMQSRNEEALILMEKCFEVRKRVIGSHHPDTESSLETLNEWRMEKLEN